MDRSMEGPGRRGRCVNPNGCPVEHEPSVKGDKGNRQ